MKKLLALPLLMLLILSVSCKKDVMPTHYLTLSLNFPTGFNIGSVPLGTEVKFTNNETGRESIITTNGSSVVFSILAEGSYDVSCSFTVKDGGQEYIFNGIMSHFLLNQATIVPMPMVLVKNTGGFIFKEIYFSGSKTPDNKPYTSDQFLEIYNNSSETLYADGLCISVLEPAPNKPSVWANADGSLMDRLPCTYHQWIIPGSGKEHPVLPGKSILIAVDGIDHKTDPNGNPLSPVNLSNADWETYVASAGRDTDSPGVPNLTLMYATLSSMTDWVMSNQGPAVILFRLPVPWDQFVANATNFMTKPTSTQTVQYMMIPKSYVIDAVEVVYADEASRYKRLPTELDAGYTYIEAGTLSSKSIRRKAKMIVDGRVIYKDTNNSTVDFLHNIIPTPRINPTTVEY
jgi:hypothetical protein